jgi:hypothetical protein
MWRNARNRARRKGLPFNIEVADIIIPDVCPILQIPFDMSGNRSQYSPSLDRIIPDLGYVKGNIMVVCDKANAMKNCATFDELRLFADWVYKYINVPYLGNRDVSVSENSTASDSHP